jgi:hypothetical protein
MQIWRRSKQRGIAAAADEAEMWEWLWTVVYRFEDLEEWATSVLGEVRPED